MASTLSTPQGWGTIDPENVKEVQRLLGLLDYAIVSPTGVVDEPTKAGIRKARIDLDLPVNDTIDGPLIDALRKEHDERGLRKTAIGVGVCVCLLTVGGYFYWKRTESRSETSGFCPCR